MDPDLVHEPARDRWSMFAPIGPLLLPPATRWPFARAFSMVVGRRDAAIQ